MSSSASSPATTTSSAPPTLDTHPLRFLPDRVLVRHTRPETLAQKRRVPRDLDAHAFVNLARAEIPQLGVEKVEVMGTFNDSICNDGSQGSQAASKAILDASTPIPEEAVDGQSLKDQSSLPGMKQTQEHYSLHGLAVSQSQMSREAALTRKDSQKENTPTPARQHPFARHPQVAPVHGLSQGPVSEPLHDQDVGMDEVERTGAVFNARKAGTTNQNTAKASRASRHSPSLPCTSLHDNAVIVSGAKGRAKPLPRSNPLKRPRSPSPESQDSFAVLPKEIQEKKYTKQSRTFQMPLSELGRSQDTEEPRSDGEPEESPSFTSELSRTRTRFRDLSVSRTGSEPPTQPQGFQPSSSPLYASSYPQAQRQDDDDNDLFPMDEDIRKSSQLFVATQPESNPEPNKEDASSRASTQPTDFASPVATQPQEDEPRIPPLDPYNQSGATSTTSGPRSLLAMVNPRKRWRFGGDAAALAQAQAFYQQTQTLYEAQEPVAGPSTYEQTQPSEASNLPDTGRPTSSNDEVPMYNIVEETQPSESSNLPDTGRLLHDNRSGIEALNDSGETQPSEASNLPATGYEADPSRPSLGDKPPLRHTRAKRREASEDPEPESFQLVAAPSSSPDVPLAVTPQTRQSKSRLAAIEEETRGSQEIPLAGTSKQHRAKPSSKPLSRDDSGSIMPPPPKRARTDSSTSKRSPMPAASSSVRSQDLVIPSSDPRERELELMTSFKPVARGKSKKGTPVSVTPVRSKDHNQDDSDGLTEHDNDEALTELADDDLEERLASTSKRRRGTSSALKASSRSIRTNVSTPPTRSTSRMKSTSVTRPSSSATRVLALWKQDSHYYAGTLYAEDSPGKYVVHFDDGTDDVVDLSKLRRLELRLGDYVLVKAAKPQKAYIVDASRCNTSERQVLVRYDDDDDDEEVDTKNLMIPSRSVVSNWKDRTLTPDEVVTTVRPKSKQSPTPNVLPQVGSCGKSTKRLFAKTGFILTTAPGFADWDKARISIESQIKGQGGQIFEDWCRVFSMDGKTSHGGKRWVLEKDEFKLKLSKEELDRVFLLADDACHKPKFLIALALGIPCVKFDWLYDSVAELVEKEWQSYLLPAGTSETLNDARITQMVDYDWGNCPDHIRDIMDNRVPFKLLHEKSVLCVLQDVLPGKTSKRGNSDSRDAIRMIPRILLCMGAARVEAVDNFTHASEPLGKYDYVVVKDVDEAKRAAKTRNLANCVAFPWVKECLITGRILPRE